MSGKWGTPKKKDKLINKQNEFASRSICPARQKRKSCPSIHFSKNKSPICNPDNFSEKAKITENQEEVTCGTCKNMLLGITKGKRPPEIKSPRIIAGRRTNRLLYTSESAHELKYES